MSAEIPEDLRLAYEKFMSYLQNEVPVSEMNFEEVVARDMMGYGTTKDEVFLELAALRRTIQLQEDQGKGQGIEVNIENRPIHRHLFQNQQAGLIIDELDISINDGEEVNQFTTRLSLSFELTNEGWKLIHCHGSVPVDTEQDTWHINEWKAEKEKLEKLVAEQTLDLQQKNRELELESASERVRSHAMGMQEPDDIMNVLNVIKEEIARFKLGNIGTWVWIINEDETVTQWDISEIDLNGTMANVNITLDLNKSEAVIPHKAKWEHETYYEMPWEGDRLTTIVQEIKELDPESGKMFERAIAEGRITTYWQACAPFSRGVMGLDYASKPPEDAEHILTKMATAFGMAYQRFEDLERAEAQARESQIEAALERVRSRSMSMQSSDELKDVGSALFQQLEKIGISPESSWISFVDPEDESMDVWIRHENQLRSSKKVTAEDHPNFEKEIRVWQKEEPYILATIPKNDFIPSVKEIWDMNVEDRADQNHIQVLNVRHKYGFLGIGSWEPITPSDIAIYQRFAKVFEQTYTRFLDLKKAEQQAYESRVEASLERIREMAAAMNHSDDLQQIAEAMFREMEILQINPLRYGLGMINEENKEAELWASTVDDGKYLDILGTLSLTWHPMLMQAFDAWSAQHEEFIYELKGKELSDYYQKIGQVNPDIPDLKKLQDPNSGESQFVSFFPFKTGTLYAFTVDEPGEEGKSILKRFANAFEQAHIRYDDLQIAEKQARLISEERDRLEVALKELKATKDQLVQQEKLASLGQLTAGIAHEIKNPLNFVNNFSDVSIELVVEAKEELSAYRRQLSVGEKLDSKESPLEGGKNGEAVQGDDAESDNAQNLSIALEILEDIEANLRKIHEHGSRADSIVKSMLQHSRGGSGNMEPSNLNALTKEYVNLAFHGMRAAKDPINVEIDLQLDESIGEIPLIAEDFSRVLVNLCNNAFDAMREKQKLTADSRQLSAESGQKYEPMLTVRTIKNESAVKIEIEDNGTGIPDEMKDKIMLPFFTTKKGTEGTGLGLSITNDIIKAHGGELELKTRENVYTKLTIKLNNK
ncbi:MAG: ATP-binding protein [Balneolaceae bacterium]|nr:ATP-binding protein [Balneolaceae bacterium]